MSTTPKIMRRERGYYSGRAFRPRRPVGGWKWDDPPQAVEAMDRWYCRRHCSPACEAGQDYRRISRVRAAYSRKRRRRGADRD